MSTMNMVNSRVIGLLVLGLVLLVAMWQDMAYRRIPNALVAAASVFALLWSMTSGGVGLVSALVGGVVAFGVFLLLHVIGALGAGDVKLIGSVGLFLGQTDVGSLCLTVLLAGGLQSLVWAIWHARLTDVLHNTWLALNSSLLRFAQGGWPTAEDFPSNSASMPYALAIGLGTGVHVWLKPPF